VTPISNARPLLPSCRTWKPLAGPSWRRPRPRLQCRVRGSSALHPVVISKKRRRSHRRARTRDADCPPAATPHPAARVPAHQQLAPQPVAHVPVHQRIGPRRRAVARHLHCREPGPGFMTNARQPPTLPRAHPPPNVLPRSHVPRAATPVDVDDSCLFKATGAGAAMPCLTLVASGWCCLHSLVSASTVWLGTTSPLGAPSHPAAFSISARSTGRGTASMVARPGASPPTG
jgi:hypothetical protein